MQPQEQLRELMELARQAGIEVRLGPARSEGETPGGALVSLRGHEVLFLNSQAAVADRIAAVAAALKGRRQIEDSFILPELRALIDQQ